MIRTYRGGEGRSSLQTRSFEYVQQPLPETTLDYQGIFWALIVETVVEGLQVGQGGGGIDFECVITWRLWNFVLAYSFFGEDETYGDWGAGRQRILRDMRERSGRYKSREQEGEDDEETHGDICWRSVYVRLRVRARAEYQTR